jgi:hypothetical protein
MSHSTRITALESLLHTNSAHIYALSTLNIHLAHSTAIQEDLIATHRTEIGPLVGEGVG